MGFSLSTDDLEAPTAAAATTAETAARAGPVGPGTCFIDRQVAALQVFAVHAGDGLIGLFLVRHLDEAETAGLPGELVFDDVAGLNLAERLEGFFEVRLSHITRQIANVDVHSTLLIRL